VPRSAPSIRTNRSFFNRHLPAPIFSDRSTAALIAPWLGCCRVEVRTDTGRWGASVAGACCEGYSAGT